MFTLYGDALRANADRALLPQRRLTKQRIIRKICGSAAQAWESPSRQGSIRHNDVSRIGQ
jgi:hypothetical protein